MEPRNRRKIRVQAMLLTVGAMLATGVAQAADIGLDPGRFFLVYQVKNASAPVYQVLPQTTGDSPFNTKDTPFLLPCGVQNFGGQLDLVSGGPESVDPTITIALYRADDSVIVSNGFSGTTTFDEISGNLSTIAGGARGTSGFTVMSTVSMFKDSLYQPKNLRRGKPVRMKITVSHPGIDPNPANDVMNIWIKRCG